MNAIAQSTSVFATDLRAPTKLMFTAGGNLLVAEAGNGPNSGRVSLLDRSGNRRTLLDGMPAGLAAPNNDPSGPAGLALRGQTLFIAIGAGDAVRTGPRPGTEVPNPNGPSSPILSSVLAVYFRPDIDSLTSGFTLTLANHFTLADGYGLALKNLAGEQAIVEIVTDLRDFIPDPMMIVRPSNPFGLALDGETLYIADAAMNTVVRVNIETGRAQTLTRFAPLPNPLFPNLGPPMIDAVPNSVHAFGDQLLVTFLSGFPFPAGVAEVRRVDPASGSSGSFITGLTSAIDVLPVRDEGGAQFFVLQFSARQFPPPPAPGRLLWFDSPTATPAVVADNLTSPTNVARDPETGHLFVTEIFTGRIIQVRLR